MSFFAQPSPFPGRFRSSRSPSWLGPPENWVPGVVPVSLILGRNDDAAVTVSRIAVFPAGFEFDLTGVMRVDAHGDGLMGGMLHRPGGGMMVGVGYADGMRATFAPAQPVPAHGGDLRLLPQGGHGSGTLFRQTFWVSPLPPQGPVEFASAWPDRGLAETTGSIEGALLIEAAERAVQLWPDQPDDVPQFDFSGAPALPPGGTPPADAEAAETAIRQAFGQVFDNSPEYPTDPLAAVQDGPALAGALDQLRARHPIEAATSRVGVGEVVFIDEVRAAVIFQLVWSGGAGFGPQLGYAVCERGTWKVARDTYGRVLALGGVVLPPPPPSL